MNLSRQWTLCLACTAVLAACKSDGAAEPDSGGKGAAFVPNAARGKPVRGECPPSSMYAAEGLKSLADGRTGTEDYMDLEWLGWWYEDKPFEVTIDLGGVVAIRELGVHALTSSEVWIFYPRKVEFELSNDGQTFRKVATVTPAKENLERVYAETKMLAASDLNDAARYVRVRAQRYGELPEWHMGYGGADGYEGQAWLFLGEIVVNPK